MQLSQRVCLAVPKAPDSSSPDISRSGRHACCSLSCLEWTTPEGGMRYGWLIALLFLGSALSGSADAGQSDFRVTLIGSGNPVPEANRFGPATLVEAGDQKLLFDAGRGATIRLWQLKIPFSKISPLFLTHFHSDHTVGIPDLWLTGWLGGPFGRRTTPFHVIGPTGTTELMTNLERAYAADI